MIEMKDFMARIQKEMYNCCMEQSSGKIQNMTIQMGFDIYDQEKCKEWIRQAIDIESYTPEQIEDLKIRHLFDKKDVEIKSLGKENEVLKKALEMASNFAIENSELYEQICEYKNNIEEDYYGIDTSDIIDYFIEQAKESLK